jgi:MSHA biogenesis protein MshN
MSVINQMLQDLEKRNVESTVSQVTVNPSIARHSPFKIVLVTTLSIFCLCALGFYIWQLNNENSLLKANTVNVDKHNNNAQQQRAGKNNKQINASNNVSSSKLANHPNTDPKPITTVLDGTPLVSRQQKLSEPPVYTTKLVSASRSKQPTSTANVTSEKHNNIAVNQISVNSPGVINEKPPSNSMKVSRRKLSADELAEQKLRLAEQALSINDVTQAEKLLEDVVIIKPSDSQTRKKLAALWFARQANQDAINLLSQGIALNPKDASLRIMKARMYLEQNQFNVALNTLLPLASLQNEQYQVMLANTAQVANKNNVALAAYQVLIDMKPGEGRWPLAMAVLYDKSSDFVKAQKFYQAALTKNDLSAASENFIKQRIQVIGQ